MASDGPTIIDRRTVYEGFSTFTVTQIRLADGTVLKREVEDHGDAVGVLPYDPERRTALLVRLLRAPLLHRGEEGELVEAAAGLIDEGESEEAAARREAEEETGVVARALQPLGRVWSTPGVSAERITLYLAECDFAGRAPGGGVEGEHEGITVLETPLAELAARADRAEIDDHKLLTLVQTLRLKRPDLF